MTCGALLTMLTDSMSLLGGLRFDESFSPCGSKGTSDNPANETMFVNPQYTDKRYGSTQLFMTPEPSPTDVTTRRDCFALSENPSTFFSGSSAASSFMSHSGCGTPALSTPDSSASNSRRQSLLLPESQQYYFSAISSSPSTRPPRQEQTAATDQCLLPESSPQSYFANTDTASMTVDNPTAYAPGDELTLVDGYTGKVPRQWQADGLQNNASLLYGRAAQQAQIHDPTSWNRDLTADFCSITAPASHTLGLSQPLFRHTQPTIFEGPASQPDMDAYDTAGSSSPNAPSLAPAWEYPGEEFGADGTGSNVSTTACSYPSGGIKQDSDDSLVHSKRSPRSVLKSYSVWPASDDDLGCSYATPRKAKNQNKRQGATFNVALCRSSGSKIPKTARGKVECKHKSHQCQICDYACNRPEHLRRHEQSKHMKEKTEMHPCAFAGCVDRKTGKHRQIIARFDNLKAHYTKTHFKYGSTEKGGKNERKSMKAAYEMGLNLFDHRWHLLLEGKMNVDVEIDNFLHVWKMLGYSILETRDTKVKDVVPDWQGPEDATLQKFDPRWTALWEGTLTLEKAIDTGTNMKETYEQGLLGVTMAETEWMGIKHLDPRWTALLSGRMSLEQSEKLGVKQSNPVWKELVARRRAR